MHFLLKSLTITFLLTTYTLADAETFYSDKQTKILKGLRDSVVWLRSTDNEKIKVQWQDWYAGESTINYIYLQSPHGQLIDKIKINYGEKRGNKIYHLSHGAGDYRLEFPGYFFRKGSIRVKKEMPMVLEPAKGHVSFHADASPLYFSVPEENRHFALCGRYNNGPSRIKLYNPHNHIHDELVLTKNPPTLHFDCLKIENPASGNWRIEFSAKGKIAFWLDGINNYFALSTEDLFTPVLKPGKVTITTKDLSTHPMGNLGSQLVYNTAEKKIFDAIAYMKLNSFNHYIDHSWREPFNPDFPNGGDNDDAFVINWDGFRWEDERLDWYHIDLGAQISAIFDSRDSWLNAPLTTEKQEEFSEFVLAYISHVNESKNYNIRWFSLWDEPNLEKFTYSQYQSLVKKVGTRLKSSSNPKSVVNTSLLAISSSGFDVSLSDKERLGMDWAKKIYASYDMLVDGIAFDYWDIRDLIELWRYNDAVIKAREIIVANDSDDNTDEDIIINQTSMSSGNSSSAYDVNTHFGALWLAGAVSNAFNSGHLDAFHYFPTVDDHHHMKGLLYSDRLPPPLPYGKKIKSYSLKPIGHSMALINRNILDEVITTHSDSLEVDALLTVATDRKSIAIIVVNKFPRTSALTLRLNLPSKLIENTYSMTIEQFGPEQERPVVVSSHQKKMIDQQLLIQQTLAGENIYTFKLNRLDDR